MQVDFLIVEPDPALGELIAYPFENDGYRPTFLRDLSRFDGTGAHYSLPHFLFAIVAREVFLEDVVLPIDRELVIFTMQWEDSLPEGYDNKVFRKPFSPRELYRTVKELLARRQPSEAAVAHRKVSSEVLEHLSASSSESIRQLGAALELCRTCQLRCPGPLACGEVVSILGPRTRGTSRSGNQRSQDS